jgi:cation diffusion facilitator CzcD-associated flavoprotein CzcO
VQLGTAVTRIARAGGRFSVETAGGRFTAKDVVLANGAFQRPRILPRRGDSRGYVHQLHSHAFAELLPFTEIASAKPDQSHSWRDLAPWIPGLS